MGINNIGMEYVGRGELLEVETESKLDNLGRFRQVN